MVDRERERGRSETIQWLEANPTGSSAEFRSFVVQHAGAPPQGSAATADIEAVHAAAGKRDAAHNVQALWVDGHVFEPWNAESARYRDRVGPEQAQAGLNLLSQAQELAADIVFPVKDMHRRARPHDTDPTIAVLDGIQHASGPSFPSAHSSNSYASQAVLAQLMPDRSSDLAHLAEQIGYARVYAGVHFPTDIAAGAYVGSAAATYLQNRPSVDPR
jgi:acid phosphatase (class A)